MPDKVNGFPRPDRWHSWFVGGGPGLHGRGDLLAFAERRIDAARAGEGHLLLLSGEAGIGKTRLLNEARDRAEEHGFTVWAAGAFPQDVELPAGVLLDLGHSMSRSGQPDIARRGQDLVDDLATAAVVAAESGDAHRRRRLLVLDAVRRLEGLADDAPALLTLEDLHWSDELSLEVIGHLARGLRRLPLLVIGTLRTDELHADAPVRAWRSRLILQRLGEEVRLPRLDLDETTRMVTELLPGGRRAGRRLAALVHERSGGVPLHVEELVHAAAQGHLAANPSYVPETLADAIRQRFGALAPSVQDVAVAAAVIRRSFDLELLGSVADVSAEDAAASVDVLVHLQFLHRESPGWFGFRHALIRDAVELGAPLALRRSLHARVAEAARHRPDLGGPAYWSAHHEEAGQLEEASAAASHAALRASTLSAHQEALDLLNRALRCLRDHDPTHRADLLSRRAAEAAATDDNAQAAEDYGAARTLLLEAGRPLAAAALVPGLVSARHLLGDPLPDRLALLEQGLREVEQDPSAETAPGPRRVRADLVAAQAAALLVDDRLDDAIVAGEQALALAGDREERTRLDTAATLGSVLMFAGRIDEGLAQLEQAIHRASELGLEAEAARGYRMIGSSTSTLVEYAHAERWLPEGMEYTARTEQWNHHHYMASHQAHVWWCRGRFDEAERAAHQALADGEGGVTTRIVAQHVTGFVGLARGHVDQAVRVLAEARAAGEEMHELQRFAPAVWGLAECALLREEHAEVVALTEAGYDAAHEVADAANLFPFLVPGTRARLALPDPAAAQDWVHRVSADLLARAVPGTLAAVDHAAGLLHLAGGRTGKARRHLAAAHDAWSSRGRWWECQWSALDLARCALASNRRTEASALIGDVRSAATEAGASPLLAACGDLGARLDEHDEATPWSPLTLRELEVAQLVARGLTNREIAAELRISVRTAGSHLEHVSAKLGISRRTEIAAWVTALQLSE